MEITRSGSHIAWLLGNLGASKINYAINNNKSAWGFMRESQNHERSREWYTRGIVFELLLPLLLIKQTARNQQMPFSRAVKGI